MTEDTTSPRRWLHISPDEYRELPAYGSSALRQFILSRPDFWAEYIGKVRPPKDSEAMILGRNFHAAIASGDAWRGWVFLPAKIIGGEIFDEVNAGLRGNAKRLVEGAEIDTSLVAHERYMAKWREFGETLGAPYLDGRVVPMVQACQDNPAVRELLSAAGLASEVTCIYKHPSGVELKALLDLVLPNGVVDFKTTAEHSSEDFLRVAFKRLGYQWQAAHYNMVSGKRDFFFVSITKTAPYIANVFEVPQRKLSELKEKLEYHVESLAQCLRLSALDDKTSADGMPVSFMPEGWGTVAEFSEQGPMADQWTGEWEG